MSKNTEGWIRHRGGKCPVDKYAHIEYRLRSGQKLSTATGGMLNWGHGKWASDIMAYRLHSPAEQQKPFIEAVQAFNALAKFPRLDGPLKWRDRIAEIDSTTQALTTERDELVQKLAREGFALIGRINELLADAAQKHEDMGDPKNWREGDIFLQTAKNIHGAAEGELWTMAEDDGTTAKRYTRQNGDSWYVSDSHLCFHSRPSA